MSGDTAMGGNTETEEVMEGQERKFPMVQQLARPMWRITSDPWNTGF